MIYKTITAALLVLILVSLPTFTCAENFHQKSPKLGYKTGHGKHHGLNNGGVSKGHGSFHNTNLFDKHKDFHNKYYKNHPGTQNFNYNNQRSYGYGKGHYHRKHKSHNEHYYYNYYGYNPYYRPYGGYVYYGYDNYYPEPDYYGYEEEIPYSYGSTLGTVPERRSNLDVNRYGNGPEYQDSDLDYYPEEEYGYSDDYPKAPGGYSNAPDSANRTIYIWTDDSGVEHFVNDPVFIPEEFSGDVRVVEEY